MTLDGEAIDFCSRATLPGRKNRLIIGGMWAGGTSWLK